MSSEYLGVVTTLGQAKLAASVGGESLMITDIAVGDGGGAPISPLAAMTALVNEVWRSSMITGAVDPLNAAIWRFSVTIEEEAGPFVIREIGLFDADGDLIAIARHPVVDKRTPADGVGVSIDTEIIVPISETANVTVVVGNDRVDISRLLRLPFLAVNSRLSDPPEAPDLGDLHLIGSAPTGAWDGRADQLAQWQGVVWVFADAPERTLIGIKGGDFLERTADGWRSAALGPRHCVAGGTANALTATLDPAPDSLWAGLTLLVTVAAANTGAATINVNGRGAKSIKRITGAALSAGDLPAGAVALLAYDGTNFQVISALPSAAPAAASPTVAGVVRMATEVEMLAADRDDLALSPAILALLVATLTQAGLIELATGAEVLAGADAGRAVTPATLALLIATTTRRGLIELATNAEAKAMTDTSRGLVPSNLAALFEKDLAANPGYFCIGPIIINFGLTLMPTPTNASTSTQQAVIFAKAFPTACLGVLPSLLRDPLGGVEGYEYGPFYNSPSKTGVVVGASKPSGAGTPVGGFVQRNIFWIAVGY